MVGLSPGKKKMRKWENSKCVSLRENCNWTDTPFPARHQFSSSVLILKPLLCTVSPTNPGTRSTEGAQGHKEAGNDFLKVIYRIRVCTHPKG